MSAKLIFERSRSGRIGYKLPSLDVPERNLPELFPPILLREESAPLPEVSEPEVVRHFTKLSHRNHAIDLGFYPLGSCTMKYNPKVNEQIASFPGFCDLHPLQPASSTQGMLELLYRTIELLCEITGMADGTLQPFAGAHGEFAGMKIFKKYFRDRGETNRRVVLVPDSAHGTNPASAHIAGFDVKEIKSTSGGIVDVESISPYLDEELAGIMLTNPNTLGLFERYVVELAQAVHQAGGLLYYDGANMNAIVGTARPGDMGFDVVHLNLHKTFATPHGGGGPGSGPVLVADRLKGYLPNPRIVKDGAGYAWRNSSERSIGRLAGFHGNVGVVIRALSYILALGGDGLRAVSRAAVLNANYLKERLKPFLYLPYEGTCKHEFVLSARRLKERFGITAMDVAKRLLDYGVHPPTVYFPTTVPEALMIEPTETETLETLDDFVKIIVTICEDAANHPELLHGAPHTTPVKRIDDVRAARLPILTYQSD